MSLGLFTWQSEVMIYDLDVQGIVSNAHYLNYLHQARVKMFQTVAIDFSEWHHRGFDLVVVHTDIHYKVPLRAGDKFTVHSRGELQGRLRVVFRHEIYRDSDARLTTQAVSTIACLNTQTGKPCMPEELSKLFPKKPF
jgi:YbgC/YbaW family acyl-CoA thioester hydrolase